MSEGSSNVFSRLGKSSQLTLLESKVRKSSKEMDKANLLARDGGQSMPPEKPGPMKVFYVSLVVLFISLCTFAMLDWQVMSHATYDLTNPIEFMQYNNYAFWLAVTLSMPGIAMSVVTCAIYWSVKRVRAVLPGAILACTFVLLVSGLEDWIYFALGANELPAPDMRWNWLLQNRVFGFWDTTTQVVWTMLWMLIAIPLISFALRRSVKRLTLIGGK